MQYTIPLYKVHIPDGIGKELNKVLHSGQIAAGSNVKQFEVSIQEYIGNPYILTASDASSALIQCLYMAGVRPGDEVIASPMACLATNMPILNLFANVHWCDIDPLTGNIDHNCLEACITSRTKAILVYHWAGIPANLESIYAIARAHGIPVVEDASEGLGTEYKGKKIGNTGADYTVFSFYPNRHITTMEGAAIAFRDEKEYDRGQWLRKYGIHQPSFRTDDGEINPASDIIEAGYNAYMNNIAATMGLAQMKDLPNIVAKHYQNGIYYQKELRDVKKITLLKLSNDDRASFWVYTFFTEDRDQLLAHLIRKGIRASKIHSRNDSYTCFGRGDNVLSGVQYFSQHAISIPCGWWVTERDREYIASCIKEDDLD